MSTGDQTKQKTTRQLTIHDLQKMKDRGERIVCNSPIDYNTGQMVEEAGADMIIVGDSLPTMTLGNAPNTLRSTMEGVLFCLRRISPAIKRAVIVAGVPYGAYHESTDLSIRNSAQLIKEGAHSVKIQGANETVLTRIKGIIDAGVPVMGHVGLMPHYLRQIGRFRAVGRNAEEALRVYDDVKRLEEAGVWSIEMECVAAKVADEISKRTRIPIIGIGSGNGTDGQSLAFQDIVGWQKHLKPKHAKCYEDIWPICVKALRDFSEEVKNASFPNEGHSFSISDDECERFKNHLE